MKPRYVTLFLAAFLAVAGLASQAQAQLLDELQLGDVVVGHGKIQMRVTAGPSGAPNGFTMWWATEQDFNDYGAYWPTGQADWFESASFTGTPTLNTFEQYTTFVLGPNESILIELGDIADETGVDATSYDEVRYGTSYVFCGFANGGGVHARSPLSITLGGQTTGGDVTNCTYTIGYWKTHGEGDCHNGNNADAWPVNNLTLGTVNYTKSQLCDILNESVGGNGLVSLAHQLIAAKLNIANGADGSSIAATIAAADALIGGLVVPPVGAGFLSPASTSALTQALDDYNNGITGPGHCEPTHVTPSSWGRMKSLYR